MAGLLGGAISFVILYASAEGLGSAASWHVGQVIAVICALLVAAGTASAAWKKEKLTLVIGLIAIALFTVVSDYFFEITRWLNEVLFIRRPI